VITPRHRPRRPRRPRSRRDRRRLDLWTAESAAAASHAHRHAGRTASAYAAARARQLADRCEGARIPPLATLDEPDLLTAREREIAGLAANGLSDKAIAARLHLSVRTVHSHLQHAYQKLGIADRSELAILLATPEG
jgi:DNA-binding NarL/FixJ family response regulator